jgi:poly(A) polymerase Pap1
LAKLKPARDLFYLRRSIPDMTKYRVAHLFIKAWAQSRGLYTAKFGLLGGIHITSMLVPICKALANESEAASTADILASFFYHYSKFNWQTGIVFDPFYHLGLKYHRTFREPLCLLGWHGPSLNTASTASTSTVDALTSEFTRAAALLSQEDMTWGKFLGFELSETPSSLIEKGAADFLASYRTYIKISARYWGSSQQKGRKYLGWLESRCISILVGKQTDTNQWAY